MAGKKTARNVLESLLDDQESGSADLEEIVGIDVSGGVVASSGETATAAAGKRILILEDSDNRYLPSLAICLGESGDDLTFRCVDSPAEVKKVLAAKGADLVVVDLCMEAMAGFETLSFLTRHYPAIPVVVMSAYSNPEVKKSLEDLGCLRLLNNPLDLDELPQTVIKILDSPVDDTVVSELSMVNLLRLIEMEKRSGVVKVTLPSGAGGRIVFVDGEMYQASTGSLKGEDAAAEILFWENADIAFEPLPGSSVKKEIDKDVTALLDLFTLADDVEDEKQPACGDESTGNAPAAQPEIKEKHSLALEKFLDRFKSINGYKASWIMTFTGEVLASDSIDANIDPAMVGPIFNDLFRAAHEASEKIGLEACLETTITTPKGFVVMRCSGLDAPIHFHLMVLLAVDGNAAMAKMELAKIEPLILKQIAG